MSLEDPFTMWATLCDEDGIVRSGVMHHGKDYVCTGHAHYVGEHIWCSSSAHWLDDPVQGLPDDLTRVLRDQSVVIDRDGVVFALIARHGLRGESQ